MHLYYHVGISFHNEHALFLGTLWRIGDKVFAAPRLYAPNVEKSLPAELQKSG